MWNHLQTYIHKHSFLIFSQSYVKSVLYYSTVLKLRNFLSPFVLKISMKSKHLALQGVQDQNLPKEIAITLKGSIFDHTFVKSKFVSGKNNFFGKFWFSKTCKNLENFTKSSNFLLALGRIWTQDLWHSNLVSNH